MNYTVSHNVWKDYVRIDRINLPDDVLFLSNSEAREMAMAILTLLDKQNPVKPKVWVGMRALMRRRYAPGTNDFLPATVTKDKGNGRFEFTWDNGCSMVGPEDHVVIGDLLQPKEQPEKGHWTDRVIEEIRHNLTTELQMEDLVTIAVAMRLHSRHLEPSAKDEEMVDLRKTCGRLEAAIMRYKSMLDKVKEATDNYN